MAEMHTQSCDSVTIQWNIPASLLRSYGLKSFRDANANHVVTLRRGVVWGHTACLAYHLSYLHDTSAEEAAYCSL